MLTVRSCYQPTNYYHNFRHAIDVLQATFQIFLLSNLIPPLPSPNAPVPEPLPALLPEGYFGPFEILALCISAVGHDAAHPGVTNAFLTASKSSLATIFNQHSVLENLHCLTISRIVEERWPSLFADNDNTGTGDGARFRKFILEMILSTDMALHFDYMSKFEGLRSNISQPIDEKQRWLVGCCVMKSADISNLVLPLPHISHTPFCIPSQYCDANRCRHVH
jgi:3',5'-cyclic-nucleotide phosphodiesterase